jgi:hypothetical protein
MEELRTLLVTNLEISRVLFFGMASPRSSKKGRRESTWTVMRGPQEDWEGESKLWKKKEQKLSIEIKKHRKFDHSAHFRKKKKSRMGEKLRRYKTATKKIKYQHVIQERRPSPLGLHLEPLGYLPRQTLQVLLRPHQGDHRPSWFPSFLLWPVDKVPSGLLPVSRLESLVGCLF